MSLLGRSHSVPYSLGTQTIQESRKYQNVEAHWPHPPTFSRHQRKQYDERLEELTMLRRENRTVKTDLTQIKQRADDALIKYCSVSPIPRMLGAVRDSVTAIVSRDEFGLVAHRLFEYS